MNGSMTRSRPESRPGSRPSSRPSSRPQSRLHARTSSSASTILHQDDAYEGVDVTQLKQAALQVVVLEYTNNIRFTAPAVSSSSMISASTTAPSKEAKLSSSAIKELEDRLRQIAQMKDNSFDADTRRSLLELYNKMLQPQFKQELARTRSPEYLFMTFIGCVQMALSKSQVAVTPQEKVRQADVFVGLIRGVTRGKEDGVISKLRENRDLLKPGKNGHMRSKSESGDYTTPSYRTSDFEGNAGEFLKIVQELFDMDSVTVQQQIIEVKDRSTGKTLAADTVQAKFYLDKDLGFYPPEKFHGDAYRPWKARQNQGYASLQKKYRSVPWHPMPSLPKGSEYYMFPSRNHLLPFFIILTKLCFEHCRKSGKLLTPVYNDFLALVARVWVIDATSRAVCIYTAAHLAKITAGDGDIVDIDATKAVIGLSFNILADAQVEEVPKSEWSVTDQDNWQKNLLISYNQTMYGIKESLSMIFNTTVKPKFGPYLEFLGEYLESDELFAHIDHVTKIVPWEKKLAKAMVKTVNNRYRELLMTLPRDDTVNIGHFLGIADSLIDDIKRLQKRYKQPLLGFLSVATEVAQIYTKAFAKDSENILKHIDAYAKNSGVLIPYADAIEAYRSLAEIRSIHRQVVKRDQFPFNIEAFFFKYLEDWVAESGEKVDNIVQNAIKSDRFAAMDLTRDDKKVSTSVLDLFSMIKQLLGILRELDWEDEYQMAKMYTILLKSVSDGCIAYANNMADRIADQLNQAPPVDMEEEQSGGWLNDMKQAVANIQRGVDEEIQRPYQFSSETCIALNNLSRLMDSLDTLNVVDPEEISATISKRNPNAQKQYLSHLVSVRLIKAENLQSSSSTINPYVTMIDTKLRKTVARSRPLTATANPEWDEEFEVNLPANDSLTLSVTMWDKRSINHAICGRALLAVDPNRFGVLPQEVVLDLDTQGRVMLEVSVESEKLDAVFVMGKAYRTIKRARHRCIKLMVQKFSRFIHYCLSKSNLRQVCSSGRPTQDQIDEAMMPLYNYLNSGLEVLDQYLTRELLLSVMVETWNSVLATADGLLLPSLVSAKTLHLLHSSSSQSGWSAVSSTIANVTNQITGKQPLTTTELETVFSWLNFLCFDFFHNNGAGPPLGDLKNDHYQALLYIPNYYDADIDSLRNEVERLAPAYIQTLRDKNNIDNGSAPKRTGTMSRAKTVLRTNTIAANATARARAKAAKEAKEAEADPYAADAMMEDIVLRILIARGEKRFVADRLAQREKLSSTIATERIIRAAAEGKIGRKR